MGRRVQIKLHLKYSAWKGLLFIHDDLGEAYGKPDL
jgi:hypothetical protein